MGITQESGTRSVSSVEARLMSQRLRRALRYLKMPGAKLKESWGRHIKPFVETKGEAPESQEELQ